MKSKSTTLFESGKIEAKMKDAIAVWAKLFLMLIISASYYFVSTAKPLNGFAECKRLGNNSCLSDRECCSGYCFKEPGWELGVCKRPQSRNEDESKQQNAVFESGECAFYQGGIETANGEVFNEDEMTGSHRTLPFNTMVYVEVMGAGVVVRINDRPDDSSGHILEMSLAASDAIGITNNGDVPCLLKIVTGIGCIESYGNTCQMHHECCSKFCFKEMFSEVGFCTPRG
ncbi:Uncharacterized protein FWK35_00001388 [Aphis craccivora]|uniref:RlpA-like protein double-psi beta-barrel domain-containing protein n=1 Tax=Aphis craccivora TaxID=307492 RepID=A0A6G0ZRE6_APHCR|nr:Uncharacterized protein FWK35_00001388 [Aphis craccivora]